MTAESKPDIPAAEPEIVGYEGRLDQSKNTYAVDAEGNRSRVAGDQALEAFGHSEEERQAYIKDNPELKEQWEADKQASLQQEITPDEASTGEESEDTAEQPAKDIYDEFADSVRNGYDGNFKQWHKEKNLREEAKWMTFVRPAGEATLSGLSSVFGGQEILELMIKTEAGRELLHDYLSSEKGKNSIIEAIQGTSADLENRRNEVLNEKAGEANPSDEDIFRYIMRKTGKTTEPEQTPDDEALKDEEVEEPGSDEEPTVVNETEPVTSSEVKDPADETTPSIDDALVIQPGEEPADAAGNSAPGRFRSMWNRVRQGYVNGTYKYVTGENISAEEQGKDRHSRLTKRGLGALVLIGAGAGLSYLAYKGLDSGSGHAGGQEVQFFHSATGNHGVALEVPKGYNFVPNTAGHYDFVGPHNHVVLQNINFDKMGNLGRTDRVALSKHGFILQQNKLRYVGSNGKYGQHFMTDIEKK